MKSRFVSFLFLAVSPAWAATAPTAEQIEFFENRIRPVLAQECYECHSTATKQKGGLRLDTRAGWQVGGESGPAIVPGDARASLLLQSIRHDDDDLKMPKAGAKLDPAVIADFERWVALGAPDPRDHPPSAEQIKGDTNWAAIAARRARWWSFQPVTNSPAPDAGLDWSAHPVDRFLRAEQEKTKLVPADDADVWTVLRRLQYLLIGLPASAAERAAFAEQWSRQGADQAVATRVDALLASPHFGERWARHWMDWFRYSEGYGGQGDPVIENAHEYRDYLIRALNANVPYDQLIREHLAGDLLPNPRLDPGGSLNESRIGTAQFRFVEHGFFPVDALDELVKFTDNQVDVVTKATLGLTVSCARCHDHKFDAISQRDYHALFGIFASSRPAQRPLIRPHVITAKRPELQRQRAHLADALKSHWLAEATPENIGARLAAWTAEREKAARTNPAPKAKAAAEKENSAKAKAKRVPPVPPTALLYAWEKWREEGEVAPLWSAHAAKLATLRAEAAAHNDSITQRTWDFRPGLPADWQSADGELRRVPAGELGLATGEKPGVLSILPAGVLSFTASAFETASIASDDFLIGDGALAVEWTGAGLAWARLAPENFPMANNLAGIYGQFSTGNSGRMQTAHWRTTFWRENRGYLQIMTRHAATAPPRPSGDEGDDYVTSNVDPRGSWFHVTRIRRLKEPTDKLQPVQFSIAPLLEAGTDATAPADRAALVAAYASAIRRVLNRWGSPEFTDEDAHFLTDCLEARLLPGGREEGSPEVKDAFAALKTTEDTFAALAHRAAPGVVESKGFDQPLYPRGNHLAPGAPVPRAFLAALGGRPYALENTSGRLQLAGQLTRPDNPLFARVIANRIWHYVFGRGLVGTPDNFGRTGAPPTHPELLDHLASRLATRGWDLKEMLRHLLTTRTFRLASAAPAASTTADPANRLLSHAHVRRFDGEIVRDHLLAVAGNLDLRMFGPSQNEKSAPKADVRRGVYLRARRTGLNELMATFDVPMPATTRGARDTTTTPSQAISLLNSPFVLHQAQSWAERAANTAGDGNAPAALRQLIESAYSRPATDAELAELSAYCQTGAADDAKAGLRQAAHLVFNTKEFLYLP